MQVRILLVGAVALLISACVHAGDERKDANCSVGVDSDKLASTEALIVTRVQMREPTDLLLGDAGKACALLMFDVDENGRPENIRVKRVYPTRVYSDNAKRALSSYAFVPEEKKDLLILLESK